MIQHTIMSNHVPRYKMQDTILINDATIRYNTTYLVIMPQAIDTTQNT